MKLKSITIQGFKSFADRVTIQYHDGITGVIGPNGSGKSNIIDAVRWVMGEQTAKSLRADDPTDIIFKGSDNRKPLSMAEVSLTFTNNGTHCPPEFLHLPEISIGRRIYKSGEREYFMNKEPCRLKDIVDFLLAIGLGSKSYSIIQQEKRDRIIQAGPDEMREILEENAGISVFKTRRKEAEKRLESTGDKLKSLVEIEAELTKQCDNLREQVAKAQKKFELQSELREKEITVLGSRVGVFRSKSNKIRHDIAVRHLESQQKTVESAQWEAQANELKSEQLDLALHIKTIENIHDAKRLSLRTFEERQSNYRARKEERTTQKANLSRDVSEERSNLTREEERCETLLVELEATEKDVRKIDGELETLQGELEEVDESMQVQRIHGEELRSEIRAVEVGVSHLRSRNDAALEAIQKANLQCIKQDEHLREGLHSKGQMQADRRTVETELAKISGGLEIVAVERSRIDAELTDIDDQFNAAKESRDTAKEKHIELSSLHATLQKLVAGTDGLSDGARTLREKLSAKIQGFLFEKITVHKDDEGLLERALPELLQSALVNNTETLIDLLDKAEELGASRVSFVVEELVAPLSASEQEAKKGILSIAGLRCVGSRIERSESPALQTLFDRIFIARDEWLLLKASREFCAEHKNSFVFVSERGTVLGGCRELSFGEQKDGEGQGLLQRKRELAELGKNREVTQQELAQSEGILFQLSDRRKTLSVRLGEIDTQLSKEKVEALKLTNSLESFDLQIKHCDENIARVEAARKELQHDIDSGKELFSKNQSEIEKLEADKHKLTRDFDEYESNLSDKKERRDELSEQVNRRKSDRNVTMERQQNFRRTYEEIKYHISKMADRVAKGIAQLAELDNQLLASSDEFAALDREIDALKKDVAASDIELADAGQKEAELSEQLRVMDNRLRSQRDVQASHQKYLNEKEIELARYDVALQTALSDAAEKYQLKPQDLPSECDEDTAQTNRIENRIRAIAGEITELGAVNERALEEFREVEERRQFLIAQKADIETSVAELYRSIAEIEETTKVRFKEIFERVNEEFIKLFPILFPGGEACLHMLKPEDLLTTGVEILVRLPGKKQQNMSLFSGGEKALTAISLIFSLLKTTPAPFCYLDEVDAPLDEANVGRFNDVLEALSGEFQFVVITHNRRTMEVLDTIYGISMVEPGVSKLVAVNLTEVPVHLQKRKQPAAVAAAARPGASATY